MDYKKYFILVIIILITFSQINFAADTNDTNLPVEIVFEYSQDYIYYNNQVKELRREIIELRDNGFEIGRLADELFVAGQLLENNKNKELAGTSLNYTKLDEKVKEISKLISNAQLASDELLTFKNAIEEVENEIDAIEAWGIYNQAQQEFNDQRYELAIELVENGYEKLIELQSIEAKTNAIAESTTKNLVGFLRENWIILSLIIGVPIIIFLIFRNQIKRYFLRKKVDANNAEINVLKSELKKAQTAYFVRANLAEDEFQIKVSIYSEKIRELNRINAILLEDIASTFKKEKMRKQVQKEIDKNKEETEKFDLTKKIKKINK